MKFPKKVSLLGVGVIAASLALTACNSGSPSGSGDSTNTEKPYSVASSVSVAGSPTFEKITSADKIVIGVKEDQPGLGYKDPVSGEYSGFDIEIARWMAAALGLSEDKIEFKAIPSSNREQALANGDVDMYVGTYSITDKRKQVIDFAGPYLVTGQSLLVRSDDNSINSDQDLAGKRVCSATGSTPIQNIRDNYPDAQPVEFDVYSKCVSELKNGAVDAVTTDQAILLGYASQDPDNLKVVGEPFSEERYGIGLPKGDTALKDFLNTTLTDGQDTWTKIYDETLGKAGSETAITQPPVDS